MKEAVDLGNSQLAEAQFADPGADSAISAVLSTAEDAGMDIMALVLCLVITLAAFVLMAPLLSFTRIFGHSSRRMRRHHLGRQLTRYVVTRQGVNDGTKRAIEGTQDQEPEPTVPAACPEAKRTSHLPRSEPWTRSAMPALLSPARSDQLRAVTDARIRKIQEHASTLREIGWRPAARAIGGISESALRNDAARRIDESAERALRHGPSVTILVPTAPHAMPGSTFLL